MTKLEDIAPGTVLTGRATNVTDFGAFIDIGQYSTDLKLI